MKNIKNTVAAFGLMATLGFGAMSANAGILISDHTATRTGAGCEAGGILNDIAGILIVGAGSSITGILVSDRTGLMISDRTGLMISDRDGCQTTQSRDGLMISD